MPHRDDALLLRALRGEPVPRPPAWFMRQAGRYMPVYRELRSKVSFLELCADADLCCEVTLQPLDRFGFEESELNLFRYRGHGNPGPTRIEAKDGRAVEVTYQEMWGDEAGWRIQPRCKICPDAIGEASSTHPCR